MASLKRGSTGSDVSALQEALNKAGNYGLTVDGIFGSATETALKKYQAANGLTVDGIYGTETASAMANSGTTDTTDTTETVSETDALKSELISTLVNNITSGYTPKTEEEIQEQAAARYQSQYDASRLAAQQSYETQDNALARQLESLGIDYDRAVEDSQSEYASAYSTADRQLLSRGMQRSSYGAQTLANISTAGAEAIADIREDEAAARNDIEGQRTDLAQQLADQIAQYDVSQANDTQTYADQLRDTEYDRQVAAQTNTGSLASTLYQLLMTEEQNDLSQEQWEKEFEETIREWNATHSTSSGGSSSKSDTTGDTTTGDTTTGDTAGNTAGTTSLIDAMAAFWSGLNSTDESDSLTETTGTNIKNITKVVNKNKYGNTTTTDYGK